MTIVTSLCHCVLGSIGIPLNGFIAYAIVSIDELRTQTRYVLFFGMLVGNILSFFNLFTEVAYYLSVFDHNCQVLRVLLGVPYVVFFANYLLVLVDNYFAISHTDYHRTKFTTGNVIPCQIVFTISVSAIAKFLYLVGVVPLDCKPSIPAHMCVITTLFLLITSCVVLKIIIYVKTKDVPHQSQHVKMNTEEIELNPVGVDEVRVHANEQAIFKREKEAMRALMISVLSLAVLYIPRISFTFTSFICSQMYPLEKEECNFLEVRPFFNELAALHGIIQPAIFLWFCDQF